ncbi:unnamed protein product [Moneuplotes crassus]|uniref:Uncharacterized protein n=1 Tax=Euplotes crassus TaxID=5936 RepID=A0AAD1U320_EUPCR|nr:unnamed protein product [Moneuplotes crassus]
MRPTTQPLSRNQSSHSRTNKLTVFAAPETLNEDSSNLNFAPLKITHRKINSLTKFNSQFRRTNQDFKRNTRTAEIKLGEAKKSRTGFGIASVKILRASPKKDQREINSRKRDESAKAMENITDILKNTKAQAINLLKVINDRKISKRRKMARMNFRNSSNSQRALLDDCYPGLIIKPSKLPSANKKTQRDDDMFYIKF